MFDWSDLRVFLTVHRAGSFTAAARELKLDQTTVGRRIAALEAALGTKLFHRGREGLSLTPAGDEALDFARRIDEQAAALDRHVRGRDHGAAGAVRLTTLESFGGRFLGPRLGALRARFPAIVLDLHTDNRALNLSRREADLAVRFGKPSQPGLVAKKIGAVAYAVYASAAYVAEHGRPEGVEQLRAHAILGFDDDLATTPEASWLARIAAGSMVIRSNSVAVLEAAAAAGAGLAVLPCYLGDARADLVRVISPDEVLSRDLWLVVHAELSALARIRAVADFVTESVAEGREALLGRRRARGSR
ncbi:MAG: LysR family transcriptional regulator [Minicystis sp.]